MTVKNKFDNLVRLGDYITQRREKNDNLDVPIRGVTNSGFIPPKQLDADTSLYNVFYKNDFVFNPARMELNSISLNLEYDQAICSSLYEIFYVNNTQELLPEYLNLFIKRDEFARFCWYDAIGSARNYFRVANLQEILFPLLNIDIQQEFVDTYNGLKALAEQNEALIKPLTEACQAYIVDCKKKYPEVELGDYIEVYEIKNHKSKNLPFCGINKDKTFMPTVADTIELDNSKYKIVEKDVFVFSGMQTGRDVCIRLALYTKSDSILVSPAYTTFIVKDKSKILPEFLFIQFNRFEMDRYGWFLSDGSVRSNLDWSEFCRINIPIPSIEIQKAIVDLYNCAEEAKKIANDAREKMKNLCPALVQKALNG
jgi:type I restriction enzyme S subunit